jgi:outer membrane protein OmpA-like peptidoglycan-associated protein
MNIRYLLLAMATATFLTTTARVEAQQFPGFGGIEFRLGVAAPENAGAGVNASADLDLGSLGIGSLRTIIGGNYFAVNRRDAGATDAGSYTATGGRLGLRLDLFGEQRITPYLIGALTGHQVSADVPDPQVSELLSGFYTGASVGAGVAYGLDDAGRLAATGELRRTFASNIQHTAFEVGIRFMPRGPRSYARAPAAVRLADTEAARLEAERLAAERARLAAEEEQRRTGQQVDQAQRDAELARQRAAAAEEARRQEEEARLRAERAAAEAAARAAAAQQAAAQATREAEQRAAQAEQRLYDALLDLNRLIANVTGIRETERGLAVVVGQGLFATGQFNLSPTARSEVGRIAAVLTQFPDHQIAVEGHTDSVGSEVTNQALSEQRAASVRAALIAEGLDPARVTAVGFGQNRPIADNATAAGRAQNRRVEIVILGARRPAVR